jgi:hypothetical protein
MLTNLFRVTKNVAMFRGVPDQTLHGNPPPKMAEGAALFRPKLVALFRPALAIQSNTRQIRTDEII